MEKVLHFIIKTKKNPTILCSQLFFIHTNIKDIYNLLVVLEIHGLVPKLLDPIYSFIACVFVIVYVTVCSSYMTVCFTESDCVFLYIIVCFTVCDFVFQDPHGDKRRCMVS